MNKTNLATNKKPQVKAATSTQGNMETGHSSKDNTVRGLNEKPRVEAGTSTQGKGYVDNSNSIEAGRQKQRFLATETRLQILRLALEVCQTYKRPVSAKNLFGVAREIEAWITGGRT